jgi:uncharacterized protein YdaU (DUF1376 family)
MGIRKVRRIDFWPDEWLAGTAELKPYDRGLYITICALIYSRGERVGIELLKRHCRVRKRDLYAALTRLASVGKVSFDGSEIGQKRCEAELEKSRQRIGEQPTGDHSATKMEPKWSQNGAKMEPKRDQNAPRESRDIIDLRPLRARAHTVNYQLPTTNLETSPTDKNPPEEVSVAPHGATARAGARTPRARRARKLSPIEGIMKGFADAAAARDARKLRNGGGDWPPASALLGE